MLLRSEAHLLKARVSTFLGTALLCSVALWASVTVWQAATGQNPVVHAFEKALERQITLEDY